MRYPFHLKIEDVFNLNDKQKRQLIELTNNTMTLQYDYHIEENIELYIIVYLDIHHILIMWINEHIIFQIKSICKILLHALPSIIKL